MLSFQESLNKEHSKVIMYEMMKYFIMTHCHNMYEMMICAKKLPLVVANDKEAKTNFESAYMDLRAVTAADRTNHVHPPITNLRTIIFPMNWRWKGSDEPD